MKCVSVLHVAFTPPSLKLRFYLTFDVDIRVCNKTGPFASTVIPLCESFAPSKCLIIPFSVVISHVFFFFLICTNHFSKIIIKDLPYTLHCFVFSLLTGLLFFLPFSFRLPPLAFSIIRVVTGTDGHISVSAGYQGEADYVMCYSLWRLIFIYFRLTNLIGKQLAPWETRFLGMKSLETSKFQGIILTESKYRWQGHK